MKFGMTLARANPGIWSRLTQRADELGFESVWIPEHLVLPVNISGSPHHGAEHPPIPPQTPVFDALNYLSFLAAQTSSIRLGTHVYNIGLRHPFVSARAAATLDVLSAGRLEFGIGASWLREEWDAVGWDFDTRGARVDEALEICRALWTEQKVALQGRFFSFDEVMFEPKPVQPGGPPIHVGGDGKAALRRVARFGDGWIPMNHTLDMLPASLRTLDELWIEHGRLSRPQITVTHSVTSRDDVKRLADIGIDRVIVDPWQRTSGALDGIARFADEIMSKM